jgi:hypothetical protein
MARFDHQLHTVLPGAHAAEYVADALMKACSHSFFAVV